MKVLINILLLTNLLWTSPACKCYGQDNLKKQLQKEDYSLWGTLWPEKISEKGNWTSFRMRYDSGKDTLFVKQTSGPVKYSFPKGTNGTFNGEKQFICTRGDTVIIKSLKNEKVQLFPRYNNFIMDCSGKYIALLGTNPKGQHLIIRSIEGNTVHDYGNITTSVYNEQENALLYTTTQAGHSMLKIVHFDSRLTEELLYKGTSILHNPIWKKNTIAFLSQDKEILLHAYLYQKKQLLSCQFTPEENKTIATAYGTLYIPEDQSKVFFMLKTPKKTTESDTAVEVWNSLDKELYWKKKRYGSSKHKNDVAVWNLTSDKTYQLSDSENSFEGLSGDAAYMISSIQSTQDTSENQRGLRDYFITEIATLKRKPLFSKHHKSILSVIASPSGRYIAYTENDNWWLYDIQNGQRQNLTGKLNIAFSKETHDKPSPAPMYGIAGWTPDDESVLLYDRYDIWEFDTSGKTPIRLTKGRGTAISYRIVPHKEKQLLNTEFSNCIGGTFTTDEPLFLHVYDHQTETSGYSVWERNKGETQITAPALKTSHLTAAKNGKSFMFMEQNYQTPRRLIVINPKDNKRTTVYSSNPQQSQYQWGRSQKIVYTQNGKELAAALFYPANFKKGEKYPLIVQLYEKQSPYVNDYVNPSLREQGGFNITNYSTSGYFVLLPDIFYDTGKTGKSVTNCVLAAVDYVTAMGFIQENRIGLIGHSFGGYETDIILTQTDRFATAVAGAAWTDLISAYYHIGENTMTPDFWRMEKDQLRLGTTPYANIKLYIDNSPVLQAHKVNTPLLSWAGENDNVISPYQSIEFYLAFKRLGKKNVFLYYPSESHSLFNPDNQIDLSLRIEQWFAHYLKGESVKDWMLPQD